MHVPGEYGSPWSSGGETVGRRRGPEGGRAWPEPPKGSQRPAGCDRPERRGHVLTMSANGVCLPYVLLVSALGTRHPWAPAPRSCEADGHSSTKPRGVSTAPHPASDRTLPSAGQTADPHPRSVRLSLSLRQPRQIGLEGNCPSLGAQRWLA